MTSERLLNIWVLKCYLRKNLYTPKTNFKIPGTLSLVTASTSPWYKVPFFTLNGFTSLLKFAFSLSRSLGDRLYILSGYFLSLYNKIIRKLCMLFAAHCDDSQLKFTMIQQYLFIPHCTWFPIKVRSNNRWNNRTKLRSKIDGNERCVCAADCNSQKD